MIAQGPKTGVQLYNLLGYNRAQYILFRQVQKWMRNHDYDDQKQIDNWNNV